MLLLMFVSFLITIIYISLLLLFFCFVVGPIEPVAYTVQPSTLQEKQNNCLVFFLFYKKMVLNCAFDIYRFFPAMQAIWVFL
jgi:hypothetical protein